MKIFWWYEYVYYFWHNSRTWQTHRQTQTHSTAWWHRPRLCIASRGKNHPGFESRFPASDWDFCRIAWRQSFRRVSWKSAGMRNANKCHKISCSAMGGGRGKVIRNPHPEPDHHQSLIVTPIGRLNRNTKIQWNRLIIYAVILHTDRMTDRRTDLIAWISPWRR